MPYINQPTRREILRGDPIESPGELNYALTLLVTAYMRYHGESYQRFNDVIGALEGCKMELYRRRVAPYEDRKIVENGDVY